jgi:hypothetical protein
MIALLVLPCFLVLALRPLSSMEPQKMEELRELPLYYS